MGFLKNIRISVIPHLMWERYANSLRLTRFQIRSGNFVFLLFVFLCSCSLSFSQTTKSIKIGFLIRDKNDRSIQRAAQLAIQNANERGGYKGQQFELVIRSCDGPWGVTSKQAVALIYEDQVPIVVTALDGRNAHLAEQVTAKSHVVMLSTLSSDPTLSRAYVPWYFRMVPDDRQQAQVLVDEIYKADKDQKTIVLSLDDYDGKTSTDVFTAAVKAKGYSPPMVIAEISKTEVTKKSVEQSWDAVVLAGSPGEDDEIIGKLKATQYHAFLNFYNFIKEDPVDDLEIKTTFSSWENDAFYTKFRKEYQDNFHEHPSLSHAYIYDGIMLAVESIKKLGPDSESIRNGFGNLVYDGLTGKTEFDKLGNRILE